MSAIVDVLGALVDVGARNTVTSVSCVALAGEGALGVGARCCDAAIVEILIAFVDIIAGFSVTRRRITLHAHASVTADVVVAIGVRGAGVQTKSTLIDICARGAVPRKAGVAITRIRANGVDASSVGVTAVGAVAFVDIRARLTVSSVTGVAGAGEGTNCVVAGCFVVTVVGTRGALVDVITDEAISSVTSIAVAIVAAIVVDAVGYSTAGVRTTLAFVHVDTGGTRTRETCVAVTGEGALGIGAGGIAVAVVN